ncbi:putative transcriptional regulator [Saprospira grandis DSM 2844]|uniref:Putative transcriptional regulator n=1 Tax=Saprospira grandis DSM 2844 TaxID=694433 RepID=J0P1T5_9BACT|nr:S24 family peptidase [Saprospira grandis]EJF53739.1 putative transcriptional regulator [Saprospira grandis DSM 2844]
MNSVVTERFIHCHDQLKKEQRIRSSRQFALSLDYLPQSLSEILKKRRDVTIELLRKAIDAYKLNPVYLFSGEGPLFMTEDEQANLKVLTVVTNSHNDERIVHVPVPAQAGYASESKDPTFIQELPNYTLPDYKYKVGTHRSFDLSGDSMEPTLFEGDKVVCSYLEPSLWASSLKDNYVYVVVTKGDVLIKRIHNHIKAEQKLLLFSDNTYYDPLEMSVKDIQEIWYVRAKISPFLPSPSNINNMLRSEMEELRKMVQNQSNIIQNLYNTIETLVEQTKKN